MSILRSAFRFLASNGLTVALLLLLMLLTFLGTLQQVDEGLYQVQKEYFGSVFLVHWFGGVVPVPLPGAYLLLVFAFINLLCGGIVRARKSYRQAGILIAHAGILLLLAGGFITFKYALHGHLTLYEGEQSDRFQSYGEWELAIIGGNQALVIPGAEFDALSGNRSRTFYASALPFEVTLSGYAGNATVVAVAAGRQTGKVVDGQCLEVLSPEREAEQNVPGAYITVRPKNAELPRDYILSAMPKAPLKVSADGQDWTIALQRRSYPLPFAIRLDKFTRELHPGTSIPKVFMSDVTKIEGESRQPIKISMNEPLRYKGYTFYQASWGPSNAGPNDRLFSTLAVVRNPAESYALYSCCVIGLGLLIHFSLKLFAYLKAQNKSRVSGLGSRISGVLVVVAMLVFSAASAEETIQAPQAPVWSKDVLGLFSTLPVLDEGRIKPLSTYAGFKLLKLNGRRSCAVPDGRKLTPVEWLLDCLFYPERAHDYPVFSVDTSDVVVAMGILPHEKKRDRYTYRELKPGRAKLMELAQTYAHAPAKDRTIIQSQLINLAQNLTEYESLTEYTQFAQQTFPLESCEALSRIFPNATEVRLDDVLKNGATLQEQFFTITHETGGADDARKKNLQCIRALLGSLDGVRETARALALFPPADPEDKAWLTPADMVDRAFEPGARVAPMIESLSAFEELVRLRDEPARFAEQAAAFHARITQLADQRGEYGKIGLEVKFYQWKFFSRSLVFYVIAFLLVALTWLVPSSRLLNKGAAVMLVIPTALLIAGITMRCIIRGRPPVTTLYETILFTTAVVVVVSLFVEYVMRQRIALSVGAILAVVGMFLANRYEANEGVDTMPSMVAVLDTNFWLATHVTTISMGYAAGLLSGAIAHIYILGRLFGVKRNDKTFYATLSRMIYGVFCFGFFFSFIGTLLGGIWADQSWGRFWGWDPKENGALLICLWQLAALHALGGGYIRDLGISMAAVVCGMVVAFSWWGVNLLGVGLHSYGFTSGAMTSLTIFWLVEAGVVLLGVVVWARGKAIADSSAKGQ